jgi:hypothetical protein
MYVALKITDRWKEIHWLQIDNRCWEATYGPNSRRLAHLHEAKDADGGPWPEWLGEKNPPITATMSPERRRERS